MENWHKQEWAQKKLTFSSDLFTSILYTSKWKTGRKEMDFFPRFVY